MQPEFKSIFFSINEQERKYITEIIGNDIWESSNYNEALIKKEPKFFTRIVTISKWLELKRQNNLIDTNKKNFII